MKFISSLFLILSINFILNGCATILKGYESTVQIENAPNIDKVTDQNNHIVPLEIILNKRHKNILDPESKEIVTHTVFDTSYCGLRLKSGNEYWLNFYMNGKTKVIHLYPKVDIGWVFLDLITGIFPSFIDAYTGSWNYYDDIIFKSREMSNN